MGEVTTLKTALFLTVLMVLGGPLSIGLSQNSPIQESLVLSDGIVASVSAGENSSFLLAGNGFASTGCPALFAGL